MTGRGMLYVLLTVVAGAAAMLSFAALRDLAELCGFAPILAWLLPVVVDAGAAAGSLVWLGERAGEPARRFARRLALGLLGLSVAANALGHGLAAFVLLPPWWVVVVLSGIAPAVLGAMVHLAVLVGRAHEEMLGRAAVTDDPGQSAEGLAEVDPAEAWNQVQPAVEPKPGDGLKDDATDDDVAEDKIDRAAALIAAGAGRRRLSRELGLTEYEARRLLERVRPGTQTDDTDADGPAELPVTAGLAGGGAS